MKDEGKPQTVARDHWCDLRDEIRRAGGPEREAGGGATVIRQ